MLYNKVGLYKKSGLFNKKEIRGSLSIYPFPKPSFLSGLARLLDVGGTFDSFYYLENGEEVDNIAIKSDWAMIGNDMKNALADFKQQAAM